uniref:Uncharacterized protein n=1 Tax=Quercus lobata TaxID=97700 RepID=A0A7N2N6R9_QUELO
MDINQAFTSHLDAWKSKLNPHAPTWEPPPLGWVKFNFDAAIASTTSSLQFSVTQMIKSSLSYHCKRDILNSNDQVLWLEKTKNLSCIG